MGYWDPLPGPQYCFFKHSFHKPDTGPGYLKLNSSLLSNKDYQETIKKCIAEIAEINKDVKSELLKGTVRN